MRTRSSLRISTIIALAAATTFLMACVSGDDEPEAQCGNGVQQPGEFCDGDDLGGVTCASLGLGSGEVTCNDQCHLILSNCAFAPECGNGLREAGEACDGSDLGTFDCQALGYDGGSLTCRTDCDVDLASCCRDDCPADGDTRCDGDTVQTCAATADGCLAWGDTNDCTQMDPAHVCDASALDATCVIPCADICPTQGEQQCDSDVIETCLPAADGCLDWTDTYDCGTNVPVQTCDATGGVAFCITDCQSTCTATDNLGCDGNTLQSCVEVIPGCYQWTDIQDCTVYQCGGCYAPSWEPTNAYCNAGC